MNVELTKRFLALARRLPDSDAAAVDHALAQLPVNFGRPHAHAGVSIRELRKPLYELRATRALRVVFLHRGDLLKVDFVGTHAEVADYIRNSR